MEIIRNSGKWRWVVDTLADACIVVMRIVVVIRQASAKEVAHSEILAKKALPETTYEVIDAD